MRETGTPISREYVVRFDMVEMSLGEVLALVRLLVEEASKRGLETQRVWVEGFSLALSGFHGKDDLKGFERWLEEAGSHSGLGLAFGVQALETSRKEGGEYTREEVTL